MSSAYVLAAVRTPGGKAKKGKLKDVRPDDLAAVAIKALVERTGIDPMLIEDVILGCAFPEGEQGMNVARVASFKAGAARTRCRRRPSTGSAPPACSRSPPPPSGSWPAAPTASSPAASRA